MGRLNQLLVLLVTNVAAIVAKGVVAFVTFKVGRVSGAATP